MPKPIRIYVSNCLIGFGLAAILVAALIWGKVANLGHLILTSVVGWLAALMLWLFNGVVFAGARFGIAPMLTDRDLLTPRKGKRALVPVRVRVADRTLDPLRKG